MLLASMQKIVPGSLFIFLTNVEKDGCVNPLYHAPRSYAAVVHWRAIFVLAVVIL